MLLSLGVFVSRHLTDIIGYLLCFTWCIWIFIVLAESEL